MTSLFRSFASTLLLLGILALTTEARAIRCYVFLDNPPKARPGDVAMDFIPGRLPSLAMGVQVYDRSAVETLFDAGRIAPELRRGSPWPGAISPADSLVEFRFTSNRLESLRQLLQAASGSSACDRSLRFYASWTQIFNSILDSPFTAGMLYELRRHVMVPSRFEPQPTRFNPEYYIPLGDFLTGLRLVPSRRQLLALGSMQLGVALAGGGRFVLPPEASREENQPTALVLGYLPENDLLEHAWAFARRREAALSDPPWQTLAGFLRLRVPRPHTLPTNSRPVAAAREDFVDGKRADAGRQSGPGRDPAGRGRVTIHVPRGFLARRELLLAPPPGLAPAGSRDQPPGGPAFQ